jgi:hypothetical protein
MIGRGALGGVKRTHRPETKPKGDKEGEYDRTKAADLVRAWDDVVEGLVYGGLVDEMFDHFSKTDDLESHSPVIKAAAEYAIIQYVFSRRASSSLTAVQPRHLYSSHLCPLP